MELNRDHLGMDANAGYKQRILSLIATAQERYPLPPHLEYFVAVKNRLSMTPTLLYAIVRRVDGKVQDDDVLAHIEATLPVQMDLPDGVRWLEDQVRDKGLDIRDMLKPEDFLDPNKKEPDQS